MALDFKSFINKSVEPSFDSTLNPLFPILFRVYVIVAIFFGSASGENGGMFDYEFQFQILSLIILIFLALLVSFNRLDIQKLKNFSENQGKEFPFKQEEFGKFRKTINAIIILLFVLALYMADAHIIIRKVALGKQYLGLNIALIGNFIAGIFLILSKPIEALKIMFFRAVEMYKTYIHSIFISIGIIICFSLFWDKEFPVTMLAFNAVLLYNEIKTYNYYLKNKNTWEKPKLP